jgi:hypothetical protein
MLEMNCYKMFRTPKMFSDAELICQKEGGFLAKPITLAQVLFYEIIRTFFRFSF